MSPGETPYDRVPAQQRWSTFSTDLQAGRGDAQGSVRFTISDTDAIASAGSCFAGRLAENMRLRSPAYLTAEEAPRWFSPEKAAAWGFGPFSARYGLVYSATQLQQLIDRAYGTFVPVETAWARDGRFVDPYRPRTMPDGYASIAELEDDRAQHFAAVRHVFERADVFVYTLGLTEAWRDRRDGAVYPYCPGLIAGEFDPAIHELYDTGVRENVEALEAFVQRLRAVNPRVRIVLSVSPVPLGATMRPEHVARAATYSKSVLRVAAQELYDAHDFIDYFASYEMVSQSFFGNDPYVEDRRHLKPSVIRDVVDLFFASYFGTAREVGTAPEAGAAARGESRVLTEPVPCDEDIFAR
jgi:hypothetical protein